MTPVPTDGLTFSQDGTTATLQMTNVPIIDQPRWPAMDAETTPAFMDFKLVFKATTEPVKYEDPLRQFRFEGFKANAQLEATLPGAFNRFHVQNRSARNLKVRLRRDGHGSERKILRAAEELNAT